MGAPMSYLYRIEDINGSGPYRSLSPEKFNYHNRSTRRPTPYRDFPVNHVGEAIQSRMLMHQYKFAFSSLAQLQRWFTQKNLVLCRDLGCFIAIYWCEEPALYEHQALITSPCSLIARHPIHPYAKHWPLAGETIKLYL